MGLVAVAAATLNAAGHVAAAAYGTVAFSFATIAAAGGVIVLGFGIIPAAGAVLAASLSSAVCLSIAADWRRTDTDARNAARTTAEPVTRRPPLLPQDAARRCRRRHPAVHPDRCADGRIVIPVRGVVAHLCLPAVRDAARARVGRRRFRDDAGYRRQPPRTGPRPRRRRHNRAHSKLRSEFPCRRRLRWLRWRTNVGLFERGAFGACDTAAVAAALTAIALGLPDMRLKRFCAVSFAHEDTHTPLLTALAGLATAAAGGRYAVSSVCTVPPPRLQAGWVSALILGLVLTGRHRLQPDHDLRRRLPRRWAPATAVMGIVVAALQALVAMLPGAGASQAMRISAMVALVTSGLGIPFAALQLLGIGSLKELLAAVRRG